MALAGRGDEVAGLDVPAELSPYAPPQAAWQRAADLYPGSGTVIWLDHGSDTAYFSYLKG